MKQQAEMNLKLNKVYQVLLSQKRGDSTTPDVSDISTDDEDTSKFITVRKSVPFSSILL